MTKSICITGATGNVGLETLRFLLQKNEENRIIAAVQNIAAAAILFEKEFGKEAAKKIELRRFDMMNPVPVLIDEALKGVKQLFLMRPPQISDVPTYIQPIIEAAKRGGVGHIVFLSLNGVEEQKQTPHYAIGQLLRKSSIEWTFLRPSFFMQNLTTTHREEIARRNEIFVPAGDGKTNFIDVQDIGEVAAVVMLESEKHYGKAYSLTGAKSYTYQEIAEHLSKHLGRKITYARPSKARFFLRKYIVERLPFSFVLVMIYLYHQTINGRADNYSPDIASLLGHPPTSFEEFVKRNENQWKENEVT